MFDSLLASLAVVFPMAVLMGLGAGVRNVGIIDRPTMRALDKLLFKVFMPTLLFKNIYETDLAANFNVKEVVFAIVGMLVVFAAALTVPSRLVKDHNQAASIGQAIIRSNYILFGIAVAEAIYGEGNTGPVALLGAFVVPLSNAMAVVILELNRSGKANPGKLLLSILKNPMVIAALLALALIVLKIQIPGLIWSVVKDVAGVTTTLSFLSLGVSLDLGELKTNRYPLTVGVLLRMLAVPALLLPIAVLFGFRGPALCALMILFAAPAAVASYPMAVAMGADGQLSGQLVCVTTLVSVGTIFCLTFLFRTLGML